MEYIVINCGYGNGPYLRATEIALALRGQLGERQPIIIPLLYGSRQRRIMREEFGERDAFVFDEKLGEIIRSVCFEGKAYETFLTQWLGKASEAGAEAKTYLLETYGSKLTEISRAPLIALGCFRSFYCSFARSSRVLKHAATDSAVRVEKELLTRAAKQMKALEDDYDLHLISEPGTFAGHEKGDIPIPPTARTPVCNRNDIERGIYVTVSGIPGIQSLTHLARKTGLTLYASDASRIEGAIEAPPSVLAHTNIVGHVARAGWGSIWLSLLSDTPMLTPAYDPSDDPEILLNNRRLEELGIGRIAREGVTLEDVFACTPRCRKLREELTQRFGTLDGAVYAADIIAKHFLKSAA